ncbi:hypothetical protein DYB37_008336 [Aphanomyces astaci]|uniref:FYVE-type domain-containing protein n=1 Tax=Aphanomyces astaci TaxID=112090 RepID=A0A397ARS7_APHAT|nr:hypothetical protein DYB36_013506 [Aphanomyces astaci]RHY14148.1 hypothetical protein DYB25_011100 [Aphanomyces astaci]RHY70546.1 hypothetical protein DYB34_005386 [Aphanomyces astaci]RHY76055.1 hypothetical protein DYB30_013487 [Aphanomyces astaci]RHY88025.1 hypothetical protein DYB35_008471 [Aphanomyces astaci]
MTTKLPLPRDFFRCPPLSASDTEAFKKLSRRASTELAICARLTKGPIEWTEDVTEPGLVMYAGVDSAGTDVFTYASVTDVNGTLDEVAAMFYAATASTEHSRHPAKHILDSHRLYTVVKPSPAFPRHAIHMRWMVMETPMKGLGVVSPRDFCVLELDSRRGWVRSVVSVELDCCPPLDHVLGFVRGEFLRSGHVVVETDRPGVLQVTHIVQLDLKLHAPQWMLKRGVRARCRGVLAIDLLLRERRLSRSGSFLAPAELVAKDSRSTCALCHHTFGMLHHKTNCRKCGDVVCSRCSKIWSVPLLNAVTALRVCTSCSLSASSPTVIGQRGARFTTSSAESTSPRHRTATHPSVHVVYYSNRNEDASNFAQNVRLRAATADNSDIAMLEDSMWRRRQQSLSSEVDPDGWST